ncbi:MAG: carbamoyltransferase HypF [Solirubrobacteraceae bacterium]
MSGERSVSTATTAAARRRTRVRVEGTVQGVGFRPYVYRLARELGLDGWVLNDARGVLLEVEGPDGSVGRFLARLGSEAPPLAVLEQVATDDLAPIGGSGFEIVASPHGEAADAPVAPDTATCGDCLRELLDPADRRHRYPFINCTNCGPRFTIVRGVPYDRPLTTMAAFTMCAACQAEYEDPADRRFHAQPNACPRCGPSMSLLDRGGAAVQLRDGLDPVAAAAAALAGGAIVAVKGLGGYHLACRAGDEAAVARLRASKHREDKPFALMAADIERAAELVALGSAERALLASPARPIVLAPRQPGAAVAAAVAPGAPELGVMLPYSALHHLLLAGVGGALVMTSGNVSDEPIAYRDEDALAGLGAIADLFLVHDRVIETRTDDSVVRAVAGVGTILRRSRGYVPGALALADVRRPLLACGAELKSTFCVAKGARAWVSHHIGDLHNYQTLRCFAEGVEHFQRLFAVTPEVVAHDLHPEYLSTKYALERDGVELIGVQHHHAHLAACLAEHGVRGPAIGAIYDGTGYGSDGTVWGGELLLGDQAGFTRVGSLYPVRLPGGERAIKQPWRMAGAWLVASEEGGEWRGAGSAGEGGAGEARASAGGAAGEGPEPPLAVPAALRDRVDPAVWGSVVALARSGLASPQTSSIGRLFDAVAALCGIRLEVTYEGQAAIELEASCDPGETGSYPIALTAAGGLLLLDPREMLLAIAADVAADARTAAIATRFHASIARATVDACASLAASHGTETIVLSGGVFANRVLLTRTTAGLAAAGLCVLIPRRLPAGDGAISYGQAAVAAAQLASR